MLKRVVSVITCLCLICTLCSCKSATDGSEAISWDMPYKDVTDKLENLGINNEDVWGINDVEELIARNPYDMILDGDRVYVSCGNYNENKGPVKINAYKNDSTTATLCGTLPSEQINEFYSFDGYTFALGVDPQAWMTGELYYTKNGTGEWNVIRNAFSNNIHCYDMVKYHGNYYFCGSNVGYKTVDGKSVQCSKPSAFKLEGKFTDEVTNADFTEVYTLDKNGEPISHVDEGVPRYYQFFIFNDTLIAYNYDWWYKQKNNGLYIYNEEKGYFEYSDKYDAEFLNNMYQNSIQDKEKIEHDFQWKDKYYFISNGLYSTSDFKNYNKQKISGYEDYIMHDVIFRDDYALCLASVQIDATTFKNIVFKTTDFKNYKPLFNFDTPLFARSFELSGKTFYFGLGFYSDYYRNSSGEIVKWQYDLPLNKNKCGTILRYTYGK